MTPFDPEEMAHELAKSIAQMREILAPIDEAVTGYRKQLEDQGWSPTAAESMALEFHRLLMGSMYGGQK